MSACVRDSLCLPLFAEDAPEGEALAHWRDSDVDELDAHDDLQLLAELRVGEIAASDPSCPASGRIRRGQHGARTAMDFGGATS